MEKYKRLKRELKYKGVLVDFYSDQIELPNKNIAEWDYIHHKGAAAILPVDENGKIIMVRQYRNAVEEYTLEIPAGGLNEGEDTKTCATREVEEEIGYKAESVEHLIDFYTTVAFCNEKIGIYYTDKLIPTKQNLDEDEFINVERYTLEELVAKIFSGEIKDGKTVAAILAYKAKMNL